MVNPGARVMNVSSTDDVLVVELEDGRTISAPLACTQGFCMLLRRIVMTGRSPALGLAFTGQLLMRTSASMACFVEHQRPECE